jgi:hypothetical protein
MQSELGVVMKRLVLAAGLLALAGCEDTPEPVAPKQALFVTDDCALLTAVSRDQYKLTSSSPQMTVRYFGEDGPWDPGCDWKGGGFNLTQILGPEGEAATAGQTRITFTRPHYDTEGAYVRTSSTPPDAPEEKQELCRLVRDDSTWSVKSCSADPRLTQPRAAAPNPADVTPDGQMPKLPNPDVKPRDAILPGTDPGRTPGN